MLWLLANLQTPLVRDRVRSELQQRFGIEADYERLSLTPSGLIVRGIEVASPPSFRGQAPALARLGDLDVGWNLGALIGGARRLDRVRLSGVRASVVVDRDTGGSSVQVLADGMPQPAQPAQPEPPPAPQAPVALSGRLAAVELPPGLGLGEFELTDLELTLIELEGGQVVRTVLLAGLEVGANLDTTEQGLSARVTLGSDKDGVRASVIEGEARRDLVIRPALSVGVDSARGLSLKGRIDLVRQSVDPRLPASGGLVDLDLALSFDPSGGVTELTVTRLSLLDGAAVMTGVASAVDGEVGTVAPGALTVSATVALAKLQALAPAGLVPATVEDGSLQLDVQGLTVDPVTFMPTAGSVALDLQVDGLVVEGPQRAKVNRLEVKATGDKPGDAYVLDVGSVARGVSATAGDAQVRLADARLDLKLTDLRPVLDDPLASRARTKVTAALNGLSARTPQGRVEAERIELVADASDPWRPPYGGVVTIPIEGLSAHGPRGRVLLSRSDGRVAVTLKDVLPPRRGSVEADVKLGALQAALQATSGKTLTYSAQVDAPSLGIAKPFAPADLGVRLDKLGVSLTASGAVTNAFRPDRLAIRQKTDLVLSGLSVKRPEVTYASPRVALLMEGGFDLGKPSVDLTAKLESAAGPDLDLAVTADYGRKAKRLVHELTLKLSGLAGVRAMLPPEVDVGSLTVDLTSTGTTEGVLKGFRKGARPVLASDPIAAFRGRQQLAVRVEGLQYAKDGTSVSSPRMDVDVDVTADHDGVTPELKVATPSLTAVDAGLTTTLTELKLDVGGRLDSAAAPRMADFRVEVGLKAARQEHLPGYPIGGVALSARGRLIRDRLVRIDAFTLRNEAAATALDLSGTVEMGGDGGGGLVPGREAIDFEGALSQDLSALRGLPWFGDARGELGVRLQASSGDRQRFRVAAALSAEGVDLELPEQGISLAGVDGDLPVLQEVLLVDGAAPQLVMGARTDAWSRARFQDVHPFLSGDSYLSIRRMTVNGSSAGPLAGNARLDRNLLAVDQLEAEILGGAVTGQLLLDTTPKDREIRFRGAITGVQPTQGDDRLDANAAIVLRPDSLDLQGRIQLVRIGRQHLLDLLDLIDPFREDVAINRARLGLQLGYPERVRLRFEDGFLTASLKLGGVAGLAKIDDIRGVPMGPPLQRFLGPLLTSPAQGVAAPPAAPPAAPQAAPPAEPAGGEDG